MAVRSLSSILGQLSWNRAIAAGRTASIHTGPAVTLAGGEVIRHYIDTVNADPRPFRWTKSAVDILDTIKRFCLCTLDTAECQREIIKTSESGH